MLAALDAWLRRAHRRRGLHLAVIVLRLLIGFAFVPAGLKKVLGQPFTDPTFHGPFHDFLHAFHATGGFYRLVGVLQLLVAVLLMTQRFAFAGAALALPLLTAITAFCWSTGVYPTATVATLMWLGTAALVTWELPRWRPLLDGRDPHAAAVPAPAPLPPAPVDHRLWSGCGAAILLAYLAVCAASGEVYRPKGVDLGHPGYYVLHAIAAAPLVTFVLERRRRRRDSKS